MTDKTTAVTAEQMAEWRDIAMYSRAIAEDLDRTPKRDISDWMCKSADAIKQSLAEIERLRAALRELLRVRDWVIAAGGTEGPLPQTVIEQFAKMSGDAYANAHAALPEEPTDGD